MGDSPPGIGPGYDVVIVHYRNVTQVTQLVGQIREWSRPPRHVVVVDNSGEFVAQPAAMNAAGVHVVDSPGNPGYAAAVNAGLRYLAGTGSEFVLLATQDASAAPTAVENLLRCLMAHPEAAVAAPLLLVRSNPKVVFSAGGMIDAKGRTYHAGFRAPAEQWVGRPDTDVAWADGAFLLVRKRALDSGGTFREEFFLYFEEVEIQLRLRLQGWSVRLVPNAVCSQEPGNFTAYLRVRNRILLLAMFPHYFDLRLRFSLLDFARTCAMALRDRRPSGILWAWRGLQDGRRGIGGKPPRSPLGGQPTRLGTQHPEAGLIASANRPAAPAHDERGEA
ncbi:glycosyltransferase family 2 protein [Micromonospora sp. NPDC050417]|uniref:glycosyltransferase family 2 protein n=1 Tax=Micromonospora sp. NPDC050417 TaxID=3364280 RepID=UPI0037BB23D6